LAIPSGIPLSELDALLDNCIYGNYKMLYVSPERLQQEYPKEFVTACEQYIYDMVFVLPPWEKIHTTDNERYENFEQAQKIHNELLKTYSSYNYTPIEVPIGKVEERAQFIINTLT